MKKEFNNISDFLNDDSFIGWVLFEENAIEWQRFIEENPTKVPLFEEAKLLLLEINNYENQQVSNLNEESVWRKISLSTENENKISLKFWQKNSFGWAAGILLIIGLALVALNLTSKPKDSYEALTEVIEDKSTLIEQENKNKVPIKIHLEDGSIVTLNQNSKLSYPQHFDGNSRKVILSGGAFFEITKNPKKPFYVYANKVITKVLGTSFSIKAYEKDKDVVVIVKTGKVSVYANKTYKDIDPETKGVIVTPNQQVVFEKEEDKMMRSLVEKPAIIISEVELKDFSFKSTPVSKIFDAIEKAYGVDIVFDDGVLKNCKITTSLTNENLFNKLEVICAAIDADYKIVDAQIIIESHGCY